MISKSLAFSSSRLPGVSIPSIPSSSFSVLFAFFAVKSVLHHSLYCLRHRPRCVFRGLFILPVIETFKPNLTFLSLFAVVFGMVGGDGVFVIVAVLVELVV